MSEVQIYNRDQTVDMFDGGILFRGKIELHGEKRQGKSTHADVFDGLSLVEVDKDNSHFITRGECVIMHFHELIHH